MVEALAARADSQLRRRLCGGDGSSCGSVRGAGPERRPRGRRRRRWRWAMTALHLPQGVATARAEAAAALVCLRHWRRLSRSISLLLLLLLCVVFILFATELTHYNCFSNFKNKIKIRWSAPPTPPPPFFLSNICVCSKGRLFRRLATDAPLVNQCRSHCCNCFQRNC